MSKIPNFVGMAGFVWWYGVVESRSDPLKLGRCQVRIHGWHTQDKTSIPTEDLMWAHGAYALDNLSPTPPKEGSIVQGYFIDGEAAQFPVMTHVIPGIPETTPSIDKGFSDQRTDDELSNSPRNPQSLNYNTDGSGIEITEADKAERYPFILNEPTTSRLARNEEIDKTIVETKKNSVVTGVPKATGGDWSEETTPYNPTYPWNRVVETEGGHVFELDDTPGSERVHIYHRNGTFIEWPPDGNVVMKTTKIKYEIIMADNNELVMGGKSVTINKDGELYIKGNWTIKVDGDIKGIVQGDVNLNVQGSVTADVQGDITATAGGVIRAQAPTIYLN